MREDKGETVVGGGPLDSVEEGELEAAGRMIQWERESGVIRDCVDVVCILLPPPLSVWPRLPTVEEIFGEAGKCTGRMTSCVKADGGRWTSYLGSGINKRNRISKDRLLL